MWYSKELTIMATLSLICILIQGIWIWHLFCVKTLIFYDYFQVTVKEKKSYPKMRMVDWVFLHSYLSYQVMWPTNFRGWSYRFTLFRLDEGQTACQGGNVDNPSFLIRWLQKISPHWKIVDVVPFYGVISHIDFVNMWKLYVILNFVILNEC